MMSLQRRAFLWLLLGFIILSLYVLYPFFKVLLMAGMLAVLFYPLHLKMLNFTKNRVNLASTLSVLSVFVLLIIPFAVLVVLVTTQLANLLQAFPDNLPQNFEIAQTSGQLGILTYYWEYYGVPVMQKIENWLGTPIDLVGMAFTGLRQAASWLAQYSPAVIVKTANFFFDLFLMLLVLFYLFRDGERIFKKLLRLSPIKDRYEQRLARGLKATLYSIFYGSFLTSAAQALLATLGFWIARIPGALVWGAITFFASFLPMLGTALVLVPATAYLFIRGDWGYGIFLGIYGMVVIGSADNILRPLLIRTPIPTVLVFLGLFGGIAVFGAIGILIGPMIMGLLIGALRIYEEDYLAAPQPKIIT